ncbi:PAS domain S-box protein [Leptothermofonsia sp. ETS-13]|uniref:sensor histidine kinase n=1 Tax=Leptothermofonsia sp. ETS-13 TaxID=3035696 RepID=UPI003B9F8CB4
MIEYFLSYPLRAFLEAAMDAMVLIDTALIAVDANSLACEFFGLKKEDIVGRAIADFTQPDPNQPVPWRDFGLQLRSTGVLRLKSLGTWREARYTFTPNILPELSLLVLRDVTGQQQAEQTIRQLNQELQQLNQEIEQRVEQRTTELQTAYDQLYTELQRQRQVEQTLAESEARYRSLVVATSQAVWITDAEGRALSATPAWSKLTGQTPDEHRGYGWLNAVHPEDREWVLQAWRHAVATQMPYEAEYRILINGEVRYIIARAVPVHSTNGQVREWIGTSTDITQRKLIEENLRQSESRLAAAQEIAHLGNWEYDLTTHKITWSKEQFQIYGVNPAEFEPSYPELLQWFYPEDGERLKQAVQQAISSGTPYVLDLRRLQPDGSVQYLEIRGQTVLDNQGRVIRLYGTTQDITERKQLEYRLRSQAEYEALIGKVTQRIRQSLNLDEILNKTVNEVRQLLQADRVLIYRVASDKASFVITEAVANNCPSIIGRVLPPEIFPAECLQLYRQGQVWAVTDIEQDKLSPCVVDSLHQLGVKAKIVIPILCHTETSSEPSESLWGLLIAHQCSASRQWQPTEVDLLEQLASQVGIAIQQAELYHQVQQLNSDLEKEVEKRTNLLRQAYEFESTLKRITDKVRDSLDENQILQSAVEELARVLSIRCCNAALFDFNLGTSTICYEYTNGADVPSHGRVSKIVDFPEIYSQILLGQHFQFCSLVPNPRRGRAAMLCCPIFDDQGVLGDLWLVNQADYGFSEQDIRLVQQVANQCAIALRQARLYQAAQAQVQELERLNQLKDDFVSTVSHELRTPMSNIKMATQMLEIALKEETGVRNQKSKLEKHSRSKVAHYLTILKAECQREINLINDLLDLSRLDNGNVSLNPTQVDLQPWLTHLAEPFVERAKTQQQQFRLDVPDHLLTLITDVTYLERLLSELLTNACKYTPAGEQIEVRVRQEKSHIVKHDTSLVFLSYAPSLQIFITNTGVEISEHERDRVFEKFYRIPSNDPWKHGGTGLGLALVKRLAERLGGEIALESGEGKTTFRLQLPMVLPSPE